MKTLHFLVTLQCTRACPHCFVWGGPGQRATMAVEDLRAWIGEAADAGLSSCAFEGGEPFLYHPTLLEGVKEAKRRGLTAGVVTNGYWAVSDDTARTALEPLARAGLGSMMISTDDYHGGAEAARRARVALAAGEALGINAYLSETRLEDVMFRGRAAERLAPAVLSGADTGRGPDTGTRPDTGARSRKSAPPQDFTRCPHESLGDPGRVHVDPDGNLHVCQGLVMGNLRRRHLKDILGTFRPVEHPVIGPLLAGGPAALVVIAAATASPTSAASSGRHQLFEPRAIYADACHLCYEARRALRGRYPEALGPRYLYGDAAESE